MNPGSNSLDETLIIEQCRNGDKKSFAQLIALNQGLIEATIFRFTKDRDAMQEIIQEVMIRIFKGLKAFNGKCKLSTWIYRIAFNESLRYLEKETNRAATSMDIIQDLPSDGTSALQGLVLKEQEKIMKECIAGLPEDFKETVLLHYYENMKLEDIAKKLDVPKGTVFSRIGRARDMLKERMKSYA